MRDKGGGRRGVFSRVMDSVGDVVAGGLSVRDRVLSGSSPRQGSYSTEVDVNTSVGAPPVRLSVDEASTLLGKLNGLFDGKRYVRYSEGVILHSNLEALVRSCQLFPGDVLSTDDLRQLSRLKELADRSVFEIRREENNQTFVDGSVHAVHASTQMDLPFGLTDEQARAAATDEDATLVLAGAGTGKTAAIVGKAAHIVRNWGVPPHEVLLLAFNRKAADEMRERLPSDLAGVDVATFHSFGRRIIAETSIAPSISRLATDAFAYRRALTSIVEDMFRDPEMYKTVLEFIAYRSAPYRSAFDFKTVDEYQKYVKGVELRTLNGYLVRSFEELIIANFLTEYGVSFRYEQPYKVHTATRRHQQYRPDFYLPRYDVYIEHFALDRKGRPPEGWEDYAEAVEWKRGIHRQYGTTLIETFSWQLDEGNLFETLRASLEDAGVGMEKRDCADLVLRLARQKILALAILTGTFLTHAKGARLAVSEMTTRYGKGKDADRARRFLEIYERVRNRYEELLANEKSVDFHDLIHSATGLIENGSWESQYRYVLVDEFQDISADRMGLLRALRGPGVAFFLVGDDWQSIYRFAG